MKYYSQPYNCQHLFMIEICFFCKNAAKKSYSAKYDAAKLKTVLNLDNRYLVSNKTFPDFLNQKALSLVQNDLVFYDFAKGKVTIWRENHKPVVCQKFPTIRH